MATIHFEIAPPAKTVDGLLAVPIDIQTVQAQYRFDAATQSGIADATIDYIVGPTTGNPVFDLRQTISAAWLDGEPFPVDKLASHEVTTAAFSSVRIIGVSQAAGSRHTLRVTYPLALPASQTRPGAYSPVLAWSEGPRLRWSFALSDLNAGRYLEAWAPANLMFDQYVITLDIEIANTTVPHTIISNGQVTARGPNSWLIVCPERFTALSPLVELRAIDTMESLTGTVTLPVSHQTVTIEAWKPTTGSSAVLADQIANIKTYLVANETTYGAYLHGNRFVAVFPMDNFGGMEYEGGTTTDGDSTRHETFHSWFSRGVKPAGQADGWWDEAFTVYNVDDSNGVVPFDYSKPPIVLCSLDPWQRTTPENSYTDGFTLWQGIAALLGVPKVKSVMADYYRAYAGGEPATTQMLEELLVSDSGSPDLVDAFHRFVYGFADAATPPKLSLNDTTKIGIVTWNSPAIWVRNADDDGTEHQAPKPGQDNWFYARLHNDAAAGTCQHAMVTFQCLQVAATQAQFPSSFLPSIAAKAVFALAPGATQVVKARWPAASVPSSSGTYSLAAAAIARGDHPAAGPIASQANLALKSLSTITLLPGEHAVVPVMVKNAGHSPRKVSLELWREGGAGPEVSLFSRARELFAAHEEMTQLPAAAAPAEAPAAPTIRDCGSHRPGHHVASKGGVLTSREPAAIARQWANAWQLPLPPGDKIAVSATLPPHDQRVIGVRVAIGTGAAAGQAWTLHFVERDPATQQVLGGTAIEIRIG